MAYNQSRERKRRLLKLYNETKYKYGSGVFYDEDKNRYIRYSPSKKSSVPRWLRKQSNRKYRRHRDILNHNLYKKVYDYWWELF